MGALLPKAWQRLHTPPETLRHAWSTSIGPTRTRSGALCECDQALQNAFRWLGSLRLGHPETLREALITSDDALGNVAAALDQSALPVPQRGWGSGSK